MQVKRGGKIPKIITINCWCHQDLCLGAWLINSHHAPLNHDDSSLFNFINANYWVYKRSCLTALDNPRQKCWVLNGELFMFHSFSTRVASGIILFSSSVILRLWVLPASKTSWLWCLLQQPKLNPSTSSMIQQKQDRKSNISYSCTVFPYVCLRWFGLILSSSSKWSLIFMNSLLHTKHSRVVLSKLD